MGSEWAKEAVGRAEEITRELAGAGGGFSLAYQRREARFALKAGGGTEYFSAHDYETRKGMDWAQLRKDVLARAAELSTP
ncbi:MAG TPA: hypothetical protein VF611_18045 [Pyrinomonadaceae bacterium]|jgi:hypothetical protein